MSDKKYDIVIVGGGPSALALAQACSSINKRVVIVEKESTIGGCHRVRRVAVKYNNKIEYAFTEHGPRVYSSSYKVFINLLQDMNLSFHDLFTEYNFNISNIGGKTIWSNLSSSEIMKFAFAFFNLIIFKNYGKNISVFDFIKNNNFSEKSIDFIDRICRLTDGATANNYTLFQFLQLFNQQTFYSLYQPRVPNDIGLFKLWESRLKDRGVDFIFDTEINNIVQNNASVSHIVSTNGTKIFGDNFVIAIPPDNLTNILKRSDKIIQNSFGKIESVTDWTQKTKYLDYISATFHWDTDLKLDKIWGFPKTEWGIAFIVLSDYMDLKQDISKTVISTAITITDVKSTLTNRLPDECSKEELLQEIYMQLKISYPLLPTPTFSILSPGVIFDKTKWISKDTAFISTTQQPFLHPQSKTVSNLYSLGTHNGAQMYNFTSLESAVTNGISLSHLLYPELQNRYQITRSTHVSDVIIICLILIIIYLYYSYTKRNDIFK